MFVVGRKNWLFSDAPRGARASAAIYSVTTTAKANGLNPRLYVEWLLTEMPNAGELTDEVVDSFLPWSDRVPESPASSTQPLPRRPKRCLTTS
ncbi:MAG: transposase domain-containing protein [Bifidobacterium longum]